MIPQGYHLETRKYNLSQLSVDEYKYQIDINKDGQISSEKISEVFSNSQNSNTPHGNVAGLYKTDSGSIIFDLNSLTVGENLSNPTNTLTKNGLVYNFKVKPSIAIQLQDPNGNNQFEYSVFLKDGTKWSKEVFNNVGELIETTNYNYEAHLLADETFFQIDIDGDNFIGNRAVENYNQS